MSPSRTPYEEWIQNEKRRRRWNADRIAGVLAVVGSSLIIWGLVAIIAF